VFAGQLAMLDRDRAPDVAQVELERLTVAHLHCPGRPDGAAVIERDLGYVNKLYRGLALPDDAPLLARLFDDPEATGERMLQFVRTLPEYEAFLVQQQSAERPTEKAEDLIAQQLEPVLEVVIGGSLRCGIMSR
jgi:hypothetical protein